MSAMTPRNDKLRVAAIRSLRNWHRMRLMGDKEGRQRQNGQNLIMRSPDRNATRCKFCVFIVDSGRWLPRSRLAAHH